jgi:Cof subfamily protein (haloacid dehalogenase superfamily)
LEKVIIEAFSGFFLRSSQFADMLLGSPNSRNGFALSPNNTEDNAMRNIKLIATDLDNTLLRRDKTISGYTKSVLRRVHERGILLAFATSRSEMASRRFSQVITPDIFISNGGALARANGKTLHSAPVDPVAVGAIISACLENENVRQITVESDEGYFSSKPIDTSWSGWVDYAHSIFADFTKPIEFGNVYKLTIDFACESAAREMAESVPATTMFNFADETWHQFHSPKASKSEALKRIGFELSEIAAFGDDRNDVEMLRLCGIGVAMSNAVDECKEVADYVCGDCDFDGVARWLEENLL